MKHTTLKLHKGAGEVVRLMRSLGMDDEMQARVLNELYTSKEDRWSLDDFTPESLGYRKCHISELFAGKQ
jgi:hypothetical protein